MTAPAQVVLQPRDVHWMDGCDESHDLCAHGDVDFCIDGDVVVQTRGENLTLSAAALYLLRSLSTPHHLAQSYDEQRLFPCCGFSMWDVPAQDDVLIMGCPNGRDVEVLHEPGKIVIRSIEERVWRLDRLTWQTAVVGFADAVSAFYATSAPKRPQDDVDAAGFEKFQGEWQRRRGRPFGD